MDYAINNYRIKKFKDYSLVTTDHGAWSILDSKEINKLKSLNIDKDLFNKLEKKEILLTQQNINEVIKLYRKRYNGISRGASLHIITPTLRCDMNCIYCHANSKSEDAKEYDMDKETAKKTVDFIFQSPAKVMTIEFQGGEPLLNWDIIEYITDYAKEKNKVAQKRLYLTIVSNLNHMNEEKMRYLIENDITICTSLDGPKNIHDKNRPFTKASNYDNVIYWIKKFTQEYKKRQSNVKINALITITKESLKYPKEIVDQYIDLGLTNIHLRSLNELGIATKTWSKIGYTAQEFITFWTNAIEYIEEKNKKEKLIQERTLEILSYKIFSEFDPNFLEMRSPCGAAIGQLVYMYNGYIYSCDEARMIEEDIFKLGNVFDNTYKEITTCDKTCAIYSSSINDQFICDECVYKPYCGLCPVCNYATKGNPVTNITSTSRCKIFKAQFDWFIKNKIIKFLKKDL